MKYFFLMTVLGIFLGISFVSAQTLESSNSSFVGTLTDIAYELFDDSSPGTGSDALRLRDSRVVSRAQLTLLSLFVLLTVVLFFAAFVLWYNYIRRKAYL